MPLRLVIQQRGEGEHEDGQVSPGREEVAYSDLEMHRIVGTGQFGQVRVVRHTTSNKVYALKVSVDCESVLNGLDFCYTHVTGTSSGVCAANAA